MQNRIVNMSQLRDHLAELFQLCGIQDTEVPLGDAPIPQRILDRLFEDKALAEYLNALDTQTVNAIAEMKNCRLEVWNSQENEKYIDELEQQLQEAKNSCTEQARNSQRAAVEIQDRLDHTEALLCSEKERSHTHTLDWIFHLIDVRDRLRLQQDWLQNIPEAERASAAKVIAMALRHTGEVMEEMGVTVMEGGGVFDNTLQSVIQTVPAASEDQVNRIAETFRAGYSYDGEVLRAQEVILYTDQQEDVVCP